MKISYQKKISYILIVTIRGIVLVFFLSNIIMAQSLIKRQASCELNGATAISTDQQCQHDRLLHVPSPQWQDQIIYFLMIDRFNDGNNKNNDQGDNEYDPNNGAKFSGGDIQGIIKKIDYIQNLGATAVWITPPVANQWWSHHRQYGGYHGYWAVDFKSIDAHFGTVEDYQLLSRELHSRGMYLIQDIVTNHTGNFFGYKGQYDLEDTLKNFILYENKQSAQTAPTQYPFNFIDRRNPEAVKENIYHWTPEITDYQDESQTLTYQLSGLADINTTNKKVRDTLKESYGYWIKNVGVDGFRIDTVKFVEHDFWYDFIHGKQGIAKVATKTGRDDFLTFGEVYEISPELFNVGEKKAVSYLGSPAKPELKSVLGFPLYATLSRVFAQGRPTALLAYRLEQQDKLYPNPFLLTTFVDNHDTPRFLSGGSLNALKQALFTLFTIPGIPVIYQGTEQAMTETRASMFATGFHGDEHRFDQQTVMFKFIQKLARLRKNMNVLRRGSIEILHEDELSSGILVYKRQYQDDQVLVIINSADRAKLLSHLTLSAAVDLDRDVIYSENLAMPYNRTQESRDTLDLILPARAMLLIQLKQVSKQNEKKPVLGFKFDKNYQSLSIDHPFKLSGSVSEPDTMLKLVINDEYESAVKFKADKAGRWKVTLPLQPLDQKKNRWVLYSDSFNQSSEYFSYSSHAQPEALIFKMDDDLNDDNGLNHHYLPPQHVGYSHQTDIKKSSIKISADKLTLTLTMQNISDNWKPNYGFDHVAFSLFISLPGQKGQTVLPRLNASMPEKLQWSVGHVLYGWGNALFSSSGSSKNQPGIKLSGSAQISVDKSKQQISISYQGRSLGIHNWQGSQIYITTWDMDGEGHYRPLTMSGGQWEFGGGNGKDAKIMDDILIKIPFKKENKI